MNEQKRKQLDIYKSEIKKSQDDLVLNYMPALRGLALRLKSRLPACVELNDLIGAGVTAMVKLSRSYDKEINDNFWGYARTRVYGAMLDFLRGLDVLSRGDRKLIKQINEAINSYFNEYEEEPSDEWLAKKLNLDIKQIRDARAMNEITMLLPLDEQYSYLGTSNKNSVLESIEKDELIEKIKEILKEFKPKEQQILQLYYFEELNLREISEILNITQSRISQINKQLILKIRERLGF